MKHRVKQTAAVAVTLGAAIILTAGCATSGRKRTAQTEAAITNLEERMELAQAQIDAVVVGLQSLQGKQGKDLDKAYSVFKNEVAQVNKMGSNVRSRVEAMQKQGEAHFAAWEENMAALDDEELRQMSEARRDELKQKYAGLTEALETTGADYRVFTGDLNNIVKVLDLDLTPATVDGLGDRVTRVDQEAEKLKQSLAQVTGELKTLADEMGTGTMQPEQKKW